MWQQYEVIYEYQNTVADYTVSPRCLLSPSVQLLSARGTSCMTFQSSDIYITTMSLFPFWGVRRYWIKHITSLWFTHQLFINNNNLGQLLICNDFHYNEKPITHWWPLVINTLVCQLYFVIYCLISVPFKYSVTAVSTFTVYDLAWLVTPAIILYWRLSRSCLTMHCVWTGTIFPNALYSE